MIGISKRNNTLKNVKTAVINPLTITLLIHDKRFAKRKSLVTKAATQALKAQSNATHLAVTVLLTNDTEVQALNHQYRSKNKPTNVLSFPNGAKEGKVTHVGDVVLAYETIKAEAKAQGKTFEDHLTHLVIHGVLHLLGYDHEKEKEAKIMERCEIKLLAAMGIANPYASH